MKKLKVLVNQMSVIKKGRPVIAAAYGIVQSIDCFYLDGRVRTSSGDVWKVKPYNKNGIHYVTCEAHSEE